jgi:putative addiction module component (TIGR02574 family)
MNARADLLLDEILELPAADRSAVVVALIDSLQEGENSAISEAWRSELLRRREALRSGAVKAASWAEARARMAGW